MALFNRNKIRKPSRFNIDLNLTNLMILVIMTLVLIQALGLLIGEWFPIKLGPAFILIAIGMAAATSIAIFKKLANNTQISKKDIFAVIIVTLLALVLLFFLRDAIPEIFEQSLVQLQGMVGF